MLGHSSYILYALDEDLNLTWTAFRRGMLTSLTFSLMAFFSVPVSVDVPFILLTVMTVLIIIIIFSQKMQPYIKLHHRVLSSRSTKTLHMEKSQSAYFPYTDYFHSSWKALQDTYL